jgi:hypothetical protein
MRGALADAVGLEPRDHAVDDGGEWRTEPTHLVGDSLQSLAERGIHVPTFVGGVFEDFGKCLLGHRLARLLKAGALADATAATANARGLSYPGTTCARLGDVDDITPAVSLDLNVSIPMPISAGRQCSVLIAASYRRGRHMCFDPALRAIPASTRPSRIIGRTGIDSRRAGGLRRD